MFKKIVQIWLDFLFPKRCLLCQKENKDYLCLQCFKSLKFKNPTCPSCNKRNNLGEFCLKCKKNFYLQGIWSASDFNDKKIALLIKNFKYKFIKDLAPSLGSFLYFFFENNIIANPVIKKQTKNTLNNYILMAVPLSKKRLRWRGFNQSELLAQYFSQKSKIKLSLKLIKIRNTHPQARLKQEERKNNLKDCFKWEGENLKGKNIIIIDDVYASGSTLNEIAKELKKHQAEKIWGLVLARS
jgi:ComF family protein